MAFVVDASIAGAWLLPDEDNVLAESALVRLADDDALAPDLLRHEIRSLLMAAERRGRISYDDLLAALARFAQIPLKIIAGGGDDLDIVRLARQHKLSPYDAAYLALALVQDAPLATPDRKLAMAARAEGVALMGGTNDGE